ncbi:hypothetical protein Nepgr_011781 [Nepenthes gracilis]|uniref:BZIP domain-containing protein n=1 Tax=Nepenthes gracilis TaxID=150966 RepID=A0AAD3SFQ1_NEPGR|nr:hypothetical protein Nepgr_011781 [Nepenthes gracilis]
MSAGTKGLCGEELEYEEDRMAAEVLASLAISAVGDSDSGGQSASQRVKSKSVPVDSVLTTPLKSVACSFDLNEEWEEKHENDDVKLENAEEDVKLISLNPLHVTTHGGKSQKIATEVEKEARRQRRVLANRESARQTIRKRQALHEELTRKAADLTFENENLKRDKELSVKEYQSLQSINKNLKEQMGKRLEAREQVNQGEVELANTIDHVSTRSLARRTFFTFGKTLFTSTARPWGIESLNASSSQWDQHRIDVSSKINVPMNTSLLSHELMNSSSSINCPGARCMLLCPWLLTQHDLEHSHHQTPGLPEYTGPRSRLAHRLVFI